MKIEFILFTVSAFYFWVCWIGYLFALKPFDFYAKQCKDVWAVNAGFTLINTIAVLLLVFDPPQPEDNMAMFSFISFICIFAVFCSYIGKVCSMVTNFHRKQKSKRVL
mgnify:CR=1 FL=1